MSLRVFYKIKVTNFLKHNRTIKKGHKATLISNDFCEDAKLRILPVTSRWLFLNLVLTCGNFGGDTVELSSKQLRDMLECNRNIDGVLNSLQELQLLTFEKIEPFINRIEKKVKEENRKEKKIQLAENSETKALNLEIWEAYRHAYQNRYKVDPVRNAKVNTNISQLASRLGPEAIDIVKFYLTHNDSFYLKNMHDIGHCLANAESLRTQYLKGKAITGQHVKNFEKNLNQIELMRDAEKGGF